MDVRTPPRDSAAGHLIVAYLQYDGGAAPGPPEDEAPPLEDPPWLPVLTADDRALLRQYMLARDYPVAAIVSIDAWPHGELRHLLAGARTWKAVEARRAAEHAESERMQKAADERCSESRRMLERIYRDHASAILARDRNNSLILLTCREARRSPAGNHIDGNPGLELERHLRQVADECGFTTGPPHWERASKRLLIDLYHREAESWWDNGRARGLVRVWPNGTLLESKRTYRAPYPFQRAAINAVYVNSQDGSATTLDASVSELAPIPSMTAQPRRAEHVADPPLKEPVQLPEPGLSSAPAGAAPPTPAARTASPPAAARPAAPAGAQPAANKPATVPNARKGYKLTLWVTATTEVGLADVNGLLQLDGADPTPFCQLKSVNNPLARALQEAFVAVERARARPPKMTAPAPAPASPAAPAAVPQPPATRPNTTPHKTASAVPPTAPAPLSAGSPTRSTLPAAQPSLF